MRTPAGTSTAVFLLGLSALLTIYATQPLLPALAADLGVPATAAVVPAPLFASAGWPARAGAAPPDRARRAARGRGRGVRPGRLGR